jgi:chitinase
LRPTLSFLLKNATAFLLKNATAFLLKNATAFFLLFTAITMLLSAPTLQAQQKIQKKVVAYVPNWIDLDTFAGTIDYAKLTHINVAFENPIDAMGDLSFSTKNDNLIARAHAHHVRILVSIGGGAASGDKALLARYFDLIGAAKRAAFVGKIAAYLDRHHFDGLDVDLEGPSINADYGAFVHDLAAALKPQGKLLTAALSQGYGGNSVPDAALSEFDFVNIMAYDGAGYWDPKSPGQHSSLAFAQTNVTYWLHRGLPKSKAVLGVPFYGYGFGAAFRNRDYPYSEIVATYPGAEKTDQVGDTIWYNGLPTIRAKAKYVVDQGLAGLMIWSLDDDGKGERSLLSAIADAFRRPSSPPLLLAHYMPWFEADPAHQRWGWHWNMNHYHPDQSTNGRREAASHYYPLLGLYDSNDPDLVECHVLLMKFAGIDGVLIDWSGTDDYLDYGINHRNTLQMISAVKKAGLKYAIVYEDATVPGMIAAKRFPKSEAVAHTQTLLQWMQSHWFIDSAYLKEGDRPVFLVFGSGYYQSEDWNRIFADLPYPPAFYTESDRRAPAVGGFDWPQPEKGTEGSFREMDRFYTAAKGWPGFIPAAFPRFHDIYAQAGVQKSWGTIEDRGGKTYEETLERALTSGASFLQLVTWNDWGEGTQIEPSIEFGYRDLETTQRLRSKHLPPPFAYTAEDLRLPIALYQLKKTTAGSKAQAALKEISDLLFTGKLEQARKRLSELTLPVSASQP